MFAQKLKAALRESAEDFDAAFSATIESSVFPWPNETVRRSGESVRSPRNIVDLGDFANSQSYSMASPQLLRFLWDVEYALLIFAGYTTTLGNEYPARDWIKATFKVFPAEQIFADSCRRVFA